MLQGEPKARAQGAGREAVPLAAPSSSGQPTCKSQQSCHEGRQGLSTPPPSPLLSPLLESSFSGLPRVTRVKGSGNSCVHPSPRELRVLSHMLGAVRVRVWGRESLR